MGTLITLAARLHRTLSEHIHNLTYVSLPEPTEPPPHPCRTAPLKFCKANEAQETHAQAAPSTPSEVLSSMNRMADCMQTGCTC